MTVSVPPARPRSRTPVQSTGQNVTTPQPVRDATGYASPENVEVFEELRDRVIAELAPTTTLGTLFAEDVALLSWEINLYRKARGALMRAETASLIERQVPPTTLAFSDPQGIRQEIRQYLSGDIPREHLAYLTGSIRVSELEAEAMSLQLSQLTAIDVLLAKAEQRRHAALSQFADYEGSRGSSQLQPVAG